LTDVLLNLTESFLTLTEVFPCFFLSCKSNARVKLAKTGHGPHSSTLVVFRVVLLLFVLFYVLFVCISVLPPADNPMAVNKYTKKKNARSISFCGHFLAFCTEFNVIRQIQKKATVQHETKEMRNSNL